MKYINILDLYNYILYYKTIKDNAANLVNFSDHFFVATIVVNPLLNQLYIKLLV